MPFCQRLTIKGLVVLDWCGRWIPEYLAMQWMQKYTCICMLTSCIHPKLYIWFSQGPCTVKEACAHFSVRNLSLSCSLPYDREHERRLFTGRMLEWSFKDEETHPLDLYLEDIYRLYKSSLYQDLLCMYSTAVDIIWYSGSFVADYPCCMLHALSR